MKISGLLKRLAPTRGHLWYSIPFFFIIQKCFRENLPLLDFWWHLKMGQIILERCTIPRTDIFSFTAAGKVFVVQNWLAETVLYAVYAVGGELLLLLFNTVIFIAVIFIIWRISQSLSHSSWASVFATIVVAVCLPVNIRPQIFSFLLFALFYWILCWWDAGCFKRIYWLPILMVAWVNLHGAFVLGLGLMAIFLAMEGIHLRVTCVAGEYADRRKSVHLGAAFLLALVATLANPEGYGIYRYIGTVVNDVSSRLFVTEWQPPNIMELTGILLFFFPFFLTLITLILSQKQPRLIDLVLFTAFALFGLTAMRNCAWFQLTALPILARHLPAIPWKSMWVCLGRGLQKRSWFSWSPDPGKVHRINVAVAGLLVFLMLIKSPWWRNLQGEDLYDSHTPVGAVDYIKVHNLKGNIFHPQIYGDYLLWRIWPQQRVFFDGRVHLYGEEFVRAYFRIYEDSDWDDRLKKFKIRYVLLEKPPESDEGKGLVGRIGRSANWKKIFEDSRSILWERLTPID